MPNRSAAHTALVHDILLALGSRPDCRVWKANTGAARGASGRLIRFGLPGQADISGILFGGWRLEIEVKTGGGVPSEAQRNFARAILDFGGVYILARSVDDAVRAVTAAVQRPTLASSRL